MEPSATQTACGPIASSPPIAQRPSFTTATSFAFATTGWPPLFSQKTVAALPTLLQISLTHHGEMAEWFKAHAWKACVGKIYRGFESLSLRHLPAFAFDPDPALLPPFRTAARGCLPDCN